MMKKKASLRAKNNIKNLLLPLLGFSIATGVFSALLVSLFQWGADKVVALSGRIYQGARENPSHLLYLVLGAMGIGLLASVLLHFSQVCRGGGIPTSIAAIRGMNHFKWLSSILVLPFSAMLTYLVGLPLGTEGPGVQMGTAVGDGVAHVIGGKKRMGWRRYAMTGGASAGFSLVTGAPLTAVLFAMEELHKRFSPLLFSMASLTVAVSQITAGILQYFGLANSRLFHIETLPSLPVKMFYLPLLLGLVCGILSIVFTKFYLLINHFVRVNLKKVPLTVKFPLIFGITALLGFYLSDGLGSGHGLIEALFSPTYIWYFLVLVFLVRALILMLSNTSGVTGGIFLPTLAFGAILGSLFARAAMALHLMGEEYYILLVTLGMTAFLGANSRIPLTACVFSMEVLSNNINILPVAISVVAAFLVVELSGLHDFTDTVIKAQTNAIYGDRKPQAIEVPIRIYKDSFAVGKSLDDILWPVSTVVLSIDKKTHKKYKKGLSEGDTLTVYYKTYNPSETAEEFEAIVGDQPVEVDRIMRPIEL